MNGRARSPSYPSTPLGQAIDMIQKIHQIERTNPIDREVAAKALGYSGISGRSATVLSNLIQYGLLEKAGKNEVRVTDRAVEILYPDSERSKMEALQSAANEPELFQKVMSRFTDGVPSANALESFFIKLGFTNTAVPAAVKAFRETFEFLENANEGKSYPQPVGDLVEIPPNQKVSRITSISHTQQTPSASPNPVRFAGGGASEGGPEVHFSQKKIWLGGVITNRAEAEDLIATINALKPMLKEAKSEPDETGTDSEFGKIFE